MTEHIKEIKTGQNQLESHFKSHKQVRSVFYDLKLEIRVPILCLYVFSSLLHADETWTFAGRNKEIGHV